MTGAEVTKLLTEIGLPIVLVLAIAYVLLLPEKAQLIAGWGWTLISSVFRRGDRKAVALRVQGHVNASTRNLLKHAPEGTLDGKLKLKWSTSEEAEGVLRDGEVVVFMKRARHHEENVAHALMVYLPKALLPRARRYLDPTTMAAVDLTMAKIILGSSEASQGVLDVFYEKHLDPACEDDAVLHDRVNEIDEIDLHGWLLRVMIPEFRRLGNELHPAPPERRCVADAESFARWLHSLAAREKDDFSIPLAYEGPYMRVAVIFVAQSKTLATQGVDPYRKRAKRLIYSGTYDAVYLMARDHNMWAVREIVDRLEGDGRVASVTCHEFRLRPDFAKRKLKRERSVVACFVPRSGVSPDQLTDGDPELEVERFTPDGESSGIFERALDAPTRADVDLPAR